MSHLESIKAFVVRDALVTCIHDSTLRDTTGIYQLGIVCCLVEQTFKHHITKQKPESMY